MRKFLTASVAVLALGALAGCGSSSGSDESTTTAPEKTTTTTEAPVAVAAWAEEFCGNFATWTTEIGTASEGVGEDVEVGNAASSQEAVAELYASASEETQTLIDQIEAGGAPDIDDGDALIEDIVAAFEAFDAAALDAKTQVEALATDDIAAFQAGVDDIGAQFQAEVDKVADSLSAIDTDYPSSELGAALQESCA